MKVRVARMDCGAKIGLALRIGGWRRAWRFGNPFFMHMPRIYALDLRPLEVQVREWNARGGMQLRIWEPGAFRKSVRETIFWSKSRDMKWTDCDVERW